MVYGDPRVLGEFVAVAVEVDTGSGGVEGVGLAISAAQGGYHRWAMLPISTKTV